MGARYVCARPFPHAGAWLIGLLALAYAVSDVGLLRLPRPNLTQAVPITWWRRWQPYGAALAYGSALGLGVMTRIPFGAFYVLCTWCVLKGDPDLWSLAAGDVRSDARPCAANCQLGAPLPHIPITDWPIQTALQSVARTAGTCRRAHRVRYARAGFCAPLLTAAWPKRAEPAMS